MSGFELEKQSQNTGIVKAAEDLQAGIKAESNRALIDQLKHSANIAEDLSALYSQRPYVYARVMKQLTGVLGAAKVRRLHATVTEQARVNQEKEASRGDALKKSLRSRDQSAPAEVTNKSFNFNFLGQNAKVELKTGGRDAQTGSSTQAVEIKDLNLKFLTVNNAKATLSGTELTKLTFDAGLSAKFVKSCTANVTIEKRDGKFVPRGMFMTGLDIPGMNVCDLTFILGGAGGDTEISGSEMTANFNVGTQLFNRVAAQATGSVRIADQAADVDATLNVSNASAGTSSAAAESSIPASNLSMNGTVTVKTSGGNVESITGNLQTSGLSFVADPSAVVDLAVSYTADEFRADLVSGVTLTPFTLDPTGSTLAITLDSASYSTNEQFSASGSVDAHLWNNMLNANGPVSIVSNTLQSADLTITTGTIRVPKENAVVTTNLTGNIQIAEAAFVGANISGDCTLNLGKTNGQIILNEMNIDANGQFTGKASVGEGGFNIAEIATITDMTADFNSVDGLTTADGHVMINHPNLKSDEPGIAMSYAESTFAASGTVHFFHGAETKTEFAEATLSTTISPDSFSGSAHVVCHEDFGLPTANSKLKICSGSTADLAIQDDVLQPMKFTGSYKYGMGNGDQAGKGATDAASNGSAQGSGSALAFVGDFTNVVLDMNTGSFSGKASADLKSTLKFGMTGMSLEIPPERRKESTVLNVEFVDSKLTTVSGNLVALTSISMKTDMLDVETYINDFTMDVEQGLFTGQVRNKLRTDFTAIKATEDNPTTLTFLGNQKTGLNLDIAENEITGCNLDVRAKMTLANKHFKGGSADFEFEIVDGSIDPTTYEVSAGNIQATAPKGATLQFHEQDGEPKTEISVGNDAQISFGIAANKLTNFNLSGELSGSTKALKTIDPINFGIDTGGLGITGIDTGELAITGTPSLTTSNDAVLDAIKDYDKITLLKNSNFGIDLSQTGLNSVSGNLNFQYDKLEKTENLPNGYSLKVNGESLIYNVLGNSLDGGIHVSLLQPLVIKGGKGSSSGAAGGATQAAEPVEGGDAAQGGDAAEAATLTVGTDARLNANLSASRLTEITMSASADLHVPAKKIVGGAVDFKLTVNDAAVQTETMTVSCREASASLVNPATISLQKDKTHLTLSDASAKISLADNVVSDVKLTGGISGDTTALNTDKPLGFDITTKDIQFSGFTTATPSITGTVDITTNNQVKMNDAIDLDDCQLLKGSSIGVTFGEEGLENVHGQIYLDIEDLKGSAHVPAGYKMNIRGQNIIMDAATGAISGDFTAKPKEDFVVQGTPGQDGAATTQLTVHATGTNGSLQLANTDVTDVTLNASAQLVVPTNKIKQGNVTANLTVNNGKFDPENMSVSADTINATIAEHDVSFDVMGDKTELTVVNGSGITIGLENDKLSSFQANGQIKGKTSLLKTDPDIEFNIDGSQLTLNGIGTDDISVSGTASVVMTNEGGVVLDKIPDYDEIRLLPGTSFSLTLEENDPASVAGHLIATYNKTADGKHNPGGFGIKVDGQLEYNINEKRITGSADFSLLHDITISSSPTAAQGGQAAAQTTAAGQQSATSAHASLVLKANGTRAHLSLNDQGVETINGAFAFDGSAGLEAKNGHANLALTNGNVDFGANLQAGGIDHMAFRSDVSFDAAVSDKLSLASKPGCNISANVDAEGLATAGFVGGMSLVIHPKGGASNDGGASGGAAGGAEGGSEVANEIQFDVTTTGINYTRGSGVTANVGVSCPHEAILGSASHTSSGESAKTTTYQYGLQGEGKTGINVTIVNNDPKKLDGSAGLFLREKGTGAEGESLLNITGDITFDYDIPAKNLIKASGEVTVDEKVLYTAKSGDILKLEKSNVTLNLENNKLLGVEGEVNLSLNDAGGKYLDFKSVGTFDCLNTTKVSGEVSATLVREKELTKNNNEGGEGAQNTAASAEGGNHTTSFFLEPTGDTSFSCTINDNQVERVAGNIGFMIKRDGENFFDGNIQGTYQAATEDTEESLDGSGTIELHQDIALPDESSKFVLCAGSKGTATVAHSAVSTLSGDPVIVKIKGPQAAQGEPANEITITSSSTIDVASGSLTYFSGQAVLSGKYPLGANISLTSLAASVVIENNELKTISGSGAVEFDKGGVKVVGECSTFNWEKTAEGEPDKFEFVGDLDVTAMGDKLHGNVGVNYNTFTNPNAAPTITGEIEYQITDWLKGAVGVKFEEGHGWDNPLISGRLEATDVTVYQGTALSYAPKQPLEVNPHVSICGIPLDLAAGIGLGLTVGVDPVKVSGAVEIVDFPIMDPKGIPDFSLKLSADAGVNLHGNVTPYLRCGIGDASIISAGLKIKGAANLTASAKGAVEGELTGGEDGFGGSFGLGLAIGGNVTFDVTPSFYAMFLGNEVLNKEITKWSFDLGEIFNATWSKTFNWSEKGGMTETAGGPSPSLDLATTQLSTSAETSADAQSAAAAQEQSAGAAGGATGGQTASAGATGGETSAAGGQTESAGASGGNSMLPGLTLPSADTLGQDSIGKKADGTNTAQLPGVLSEIQDIQDIANMIGAIAEIVGMIVGIASAAACGGPFGAVGFIIIQILLGNLSIDGVVGWFTAIKNGIQAIIRIIGDPEAFIKKLLPPFLIEIYDFFKNGADENGIVNTLVTKIEDFAASKSYPLNELLGPVVELARKKRDQIAEIAQLLNGDAGDVVAGIFRILGFAFTSVLDIVQCVGDMWNIVKNLIRTGIEQGTIYVRYTVDGHILWAENWVYEWKFCIPGLCDFHGGDDTILVDTMCVCLGGLGLKKTPK